MGLDELHLRVLATSSEDMTEKRNAQKGVSQSTLSHFRVDHTTSIETDAEGSALGIGGMLKRVRTSK
jgi:hypothetical protein